MKIVLCLLVVGLGLVGQLAAQVPITLSEEDSTEIQLLAQQRISTDLKNLYNTLTNSKKGELELARKVNDSFLPSKKQIFYNDNVVIESDVVPNKKGPDVLVDVYLKDLLLYYKKTIVESIFISKVSVSDIKFMENEKFAGHYLKVFFTVDFRSTTTSTLQNQSYTPVRRVATMFVEWQRNRWVVYIKSISFDKAASEPLK